MILDAKYYLPGCDFYCAIFIVMLSIIIMLNVFMLSVIMSSVVAPCKQASLMKTHFKVKCLNLKLL